MMDSKKNDSVDLEAGSGVGVGQAMLLMPDLTCLGCGCLCDDLLVEVSGGKARSAGLDCALGRKWLEGPNRELLRWEAALHGQEASREEALGRAAEIVVGARALLVTGLTSSSIEAQAAAVALADRVGAMVDPAGGDRSLARVLAFQGRGDISATLGEVRNRADVIVYWFADPMETHPRHWDRYGAGAKGRFVPEDGRAGRTVVVIDESLTATAQRADHFLRVPRSSQVELLCYLRAGVRDLKVPEGAGRSDFGLDLTEVHRLVEILKRAKYGAIFHHLSGSDAVVVEELLELVRDLNGPRRFVSLGLGGAGNPAGAEAVLGWQTGYPMAVDYGAGYPRYRPGVGSAQGFLSRGEADAVLIVGDAGPLSAEAQAHLGKVPVIVIAPVPDDVLPGASVSLACAVTGIESGGTVRRVDGVCLPLRPPLPAPRPSDREWLEAILDRV